MRHFYRSSKGLNKKIVKEISDIKNEPGWVTDFRLKSLSIFEKMDLPPWASFLKDLDINNIYFYIKPFKENFEDWDKVPKDVKNVFRSLGITNAEKKLFCGVNAQYESEIFYKSLTKDLEKKGVIFIDINLGLKNYPEIFKKYFAKIVTPKDNKFAALNSAVWSGGSFVYIPEGLKLNLPIQAYFRMNTESAGQFERTLIIAEPGTSVHYIEGCSALMYKAFGLHAAVSEIFAHENSTVKYTTIQNWSKNIYNLVTKRALLYNNANVNWIDGNFGSKVTVKYPSLILKGDNSKGNIVSLAIARKGQFIDTGGKVEHIGKNTKSNVLSKVIVEKNGIANSRNFLNVCKGACNTESRIDCDVLIFDKNSKAYTYPLLNIKESNVDIQNEASINKISEEKIFYMMSRGLSKQEAINIVITGFAEFFMKELPLEYAIEIDRLVSL